jgi:ribonuclease HI
MDAFIITDASYLERTNAAGVAGRIAVGNHNLSFKGSVTTVQCPNHGEMIAILHSLKKLREVRDDNILSIEKVYIGTDCQTVIDLLDKGFKKDRFYHPKTKQLLNDISKTIKTLNVDIQFQKIKAHVYDNPTPIERIHNEIDIQAKQALENLMKQVELNSLPSNIYSTLLPQKLIDGEYEHLEKTAYELAKKGLAPRILTKLPIERNPFADGVNRYNAENPDSTISYDVIPTYDSKLPKGHNKFHSGIMGIDRIQTLETMSRLGISDSMMLDEYEGLVLTDIGRTITGFQKKPSDVAEEVSLRESGHSKFILNHSASKRMQDYNVTLKQVGSLYDIPEKTYSDLLCREKVASSGLEY